MLSINSAIWCFCPRRPEPPIRPFGLAAIEITSASHGHAARCLWTAAIAASVCPVEPRSKIAIWLASRSETPATNSFAAQGRARPRDIAFAHQHLGLAGVPQSETGLGGDGAVIGRQRARVEGQRPLSWQCWV